MSGPIETTELIWRDEQNVLFGTIPSQFPDYKTWTPNWCGNCTVPIWQFPDDYLGICQTCSPSVGSCERLSFVTVYLRNRQIAQLYPWWVSTSHGVDKCIGYKWMVRKDAEKHFGIKHVIVPKGKEKPYVPAFKWLKWYLEQEICRLAQVKV